MKIQTFATHLALTSFACLCLLPIRAADEPKEVLFLAGGRSHAPGEHEHRAGCMILAQALNESGLNLQAQVVSGWPEDLTLLDSADVAIVYADAGGRFSPERLQILDRQVKRGMGIMFIHYGVHPNKTVGEQFFTPWIGGFFENDLSVNPHWTAELVPKKGHPVGRGITNPILANDEFYYNMRFPKAGTCSTCYPLAEALVTPEQITLYNNLWHKTGDDLFGTKQAIMWCRDATDQGRGVGFTGGHFHHNWAIDDFRKLVLNAIVWAARGEVPATGVPSKPISDEQLNANLDGTPRQPLTKPTPESIAAKQTMLRPADPANYNQRAHYKLVAEQKKKAEEKKAPVKSVPPPSTQGATTPIIRHDSNTPTASVTLPVAAGTLHLAVDDADGDIGHDHAVWLNGTLTGPKGSLSLEKLNLRTKQTQWGTPRWDRDQHNKPLILDGKPAKGISIHANGLLVFDVPEGYDTFSVTLSLTEYGRSAPDSRASIRGRVWHQAAEQASALSNADALKQGQYPTGTGDHVPAAALQVPDDLEVTIWAKSPLFFNPTNMDMDEHGRMWVAEGINYRRQSGRIAQGDRIRVLQDTTGDGLADHAHTFVQEPIFKAPLGISVFGNRIVVAQPPELIQYTDVDGDLKFDPKIDKREVLLTGFNGLHHDHSLHAVVAGPSGKWFINQGNCGAQVTDRSGRTFRIGSSYVGGYNSKSWPHDPMELSGKPSDDGHVWVGGFIGRMNPDGTNLEIIGHNMRNSYEHTVNSFGDVFQSDNDDPPACRNSYVLEYGSAGFSSNDGRFSWEAQRRPGQTIPVAHWRQEDPGYMPSGDVYGSGSPTGVAFYENGALPEAYRGMFLAADAGQRVIFRYHPKPEGAGFSLERDSLLQADKTEAAFHFRPADVEVGADGALYVADWYDPRVGGHGTGDAGASGTIYRIAPKGFKAPKLTPKKDTVADLVDLLQSPSDNVRFLAIEGLKQKGAAALPALQALRAHANPWVAARPIWLFPYLGPQGEAACHDLLTHPDASTRLTALRALRRAEKNLLPAARALQNDPSPMVRREVATLLRDQPWETKKDILLALYKGWDGKDRTYLEALGLAVPHSEEAFWKAVRKSAAVPWTDAFARFTWRMTPPEAAPELKQRAADAALTPEARKLAIDSLAFLSGAIAPAAMLELYLADVPEKDYAKMWLDRSLDGGKWDGLIDREKVEKLAGVIRPGEPVPSPHPEAPTKRSVPSVEKVLALTANPARGKAVAARCVICHVVDGQGTAYGPSLEGWGANRSLPEIANAILHPDATLAHGFEGDRVLLKNGKVIDGFVLAGRERAWHFVNNKNANPTLLVRSLGREQKISWRHVKGVEPLKRSLMLYPEALGLTDPQEIADLIAFLKQH